MGDTIYMSQATTTSHADERITERLTVAGWSTEDQAKLNYFAHGFAPQTHSDSEAVRLAVLPGKVGRNQGSGSNGNEVWAVYRSQSLVTVMLRRSSQPDANLRVAKVNRLV